MDTMPQNRARVGLLATPLARLYLFVAAGVFVGLYLLASASLASAHRSGHTCTSSNHCTPTITYINSHGDRWHNYDSKEKKNHNDKVDWPVTLLFYNNAEIDKVKDRIEYYNSDVFRSGSTKYLRLVEKNEYQNGSSVPSFTYHYDGDSGIKDEPNCTGAWGYHMRVYADHKPSQYSHDKLYNDALGFYILATTHMDYNDGCSGAAFGFSESAEVRFRTYSDNVPGWTVYPEFSNFVNIEGSYISGSGFRLDGGSKPHWWDNSGRATYVRVI